MRDWPPWSKIENVDGGSIHFAFNERALANLAKASNEGTIAIVLVFLAFLHQYRKYWQKFSKM